MKIEDIKSMARAWNQVQEASYGKPKKEAMDPVDPKELKGKHKDRKDKDIDNDGDVDKSDEYLHKRRKAVSKAIKGKNTEVEVQTNEGKYVGEGVEVLGEDVAKMSHGRLKWHMNTGVPHGRYSKSEMKTERDRRLKAGEGEAYRKAKPGLSEAGEELDELSKKTLGSYIKKASDDMANNAYTLGARDPLKPKGSWNKAFKRGKGIAKATDKLTKEAKDHGNMNNGSQRDEGLSPSAKKELARTTPMPDAVNEPMVDKKTFDAIRASGKKAPMRSNDNAQGDKTAPKTGK